MKQIFETRSSVFKAVLLSFVLGMSAGVINFFSALSAEFKIEQQRQSEISDLNFERIIALAKSSNGTAAELAKFARTATVLRPSLVSLDISVRGQPLVNWERPPQTSSRPILDALTERWITYERMDAGTGVYLRGVKDSHIAYRYFVDRQWINARTALLRTLLIMAVVWACVYLFLAKPLRSIRAQVKSPDFTDKGLKLRNEAGAEFIDLAEGINEVLARDQLLRKRNQRLYLALMKTKDPCVIYTANDGRAIFINDAGMEILGGEREDWIGTPIYEMSSNTDKETYKVTQRELARDSSYRYVRKIISKEGDTRLIEVTTTQTMIDGERINIMMVHSLLTPEPFVRKSLINDLRRMIGGISHDLNNSLMVITGSLDIVKESIPISSPVSGSLQVASERIEGVGALVNRLMTYAQVGKNERIVINVEETLSSIIDEQSRLATGYDIKLSVTQNARSAKVFIDQDAYSSIIRELIQNAIEASNLGALTLISLNLEHIETPKMVGKQMLAAGDYVKIVVSDQGKGMTGREITAAFDPFYSASRDPGRGMGLSAVQSGLELVGGGIEIESAPGVGTNVSIFMPVFIEPTPEPSSSNQFYSI